MDEPRTEAGRALFDLVRIRNQAQTRVRADDRHDEMWRRRILAIEEQAAARPADGEDGLDVERLAEAMHVWTNHEPDGSQALHLTDHHQLGDTVRRDAAGIAREYAALAAERT